MTIKASGRSLSILSVRILATGLFVCFAGPLPAVAGADDNGAAAQTDSQSANAEPDGPAAEPVKHHKRARHASRHHKSGKVASSPGRKNDATDGAENADISTAIPPAVANANAELTTTDTPDGNARAMTARANDMLQMAAQDNVPQAAAEKPADAPPAAETQVLPPDQLNDVDRSLPASAASGPAPAMTSADAPARAMAAAAAPDEAAVTNSDDSSSVDRTSLIGKIFMACGGVLTLASALRMFIG
jgi:cytoskeletal protein RodZ